MLPPRLIEEIDALCQAGVIQKTRTERTPHEQKLFVSVGEQLALLQRTNKKQLNSYPVCWVILQIYHSEQALESGVAAKESGAFFALKEIETKPRRTKPIVDEPVDNTTASRAPKAKSTLEAVVSALDMNDVEIVRLLERRRSEERTVAFVKKLKPVALGGLAILAMILASYAAVTFKRGAEKAGGDVQQIQNRTGNFSDDSGKNPQTPLPGKRK